MGETVHMHAFLLCLLLRLVCLFRVCAVVLAGNTPRVALASFTQKLWQNQGREMATPSREKLAKKLLQQQEALSSGGGMKKRRHISIHPPRGHRLQQLPSPTEQQLQQRESGWNDRFFYETPVNSNKLPRPERITDNAPKPPLPAAAAAVAQHKKEKKICDERLQYGADVCRWKWHNKLVGAEYFVVALCRKQRDQAQGEGIQAADPRTVDAAGVLSRANTGELHNHLSRMLTARAIN